MISDRQKSDLIDAVRTTAGLEIIPRFRNLGPDEIDMKSSATDLVTKADRATEEALTTASRAILPGAAVVGEEAVAEDISVLDAIGDVARCVIIDPIDGTMNFASGIAVFGVLIAVVEAGETVFALLYDPVRDDWAVAEPGSGAWLCREGETPRRLKAGDERPMERSRGLVPLDCSAPSARADFLRRFDDALQVHDLRCSCHEYRLLASGEADFIVAQTLHPWDHAAGQLLVREAGGWSALESGGAYRPTLTRGRIVTASGRLLGERVAALAF